MAYTSSPWFRNFTHQWLHNANHLYFGLRRLPFPRSISSITLHNNNNNSNNNNNTCLLNKGGLKFSRFWKIDFVLKKWAEVLVKYTLVLFAPPDQTISTGLLCSSAFSVSLISSFFMWRFLVDLHDMPNPIYGPTSDDLYTIAKECPSCQQTHRLVTHSFLIKCNNSYGIALQ